MSLYEQFLNEARQAQRDAYNQQRAQKIAALNAFKANRGKTGLWGGRDGREDWQNQINSMQNDINNMRYRFDKNAAVQKINQLRDAHFDQKRQELKDYKQSERSRITDAQKAAEAQQQGLLEQMREQASTLMAQPARAPNIIPELAPLQEVTGVALNNDLAGQNAATSQFFVTPDSVASNYTVASNPAGGGIGGRQRASSDALTSTTDTLGSKRKDEL